jgi:hypothetical protein
MADNDSDTQKYLSSEDAGDEAPAKAEHKAGDKTESAGTNTGPDPETHEDYAEDNHDLDANARQAEQLEAALKHFG